MEVQVSDNLQEALRQYETFLSDPQLQMQKEESVNSVPIEIIKKE